MKLEEQRAAEIARSFGLLGVARAASGCAGCVLNTEQQVGVQLRAVRALLAGPRRLLSKGGRLLRSPAALALLGVMHAASGCTDCTLRVEQ